MSTSIYTFPVGRIAKWIGGSDGGGGAIRRRMQPEARWLSVISSENARRGSPVPFRIAA
jgi:hypothetical protein